MTGFVDANTRRDEGYTPFLLYKHCSLNLKACSAYCVSSSIDAENAKTKFKTPSIESSFPVKRKRHLSKQGKIELLFLKKNRFISST